MELKRSSTVRPSEILAALSHALDLTEGQPPGHAARTCLLGLRIARDLGVGADDQRALHYAMLLKDSGCSSSASRMAKLFGADDIEIKRTGKLIDWTQTGETLRYVTGNLPARTSVGRVAQLARRLPELKREGEAIVSDRCERGAQIVRGLDLPEAAAEIVRSLDEHWDGDGRPSRIAGEQISIGARIACLAQTAEVFQRVHGNDAMRAMVEERRGRWFDPTIADALLAIGDEDPVWSSLAHSASELARLAPDDDAVAADDARLDRIAETFAQVIDAKSPYTFEHSNGVARAAGAVGSRLGLDVDQLRDLRRAALLHDIGKLGISNSILDKPGKLDEAEFAQIRRHVVFTRQILQRVPAFAHLARDAAAHHERLDGSGYSDGLTAAGLSQMARILAVADVYDALTADRPYRRAMAVEEALAIMRRDVGRAFCETCFGALEESIGWLTTVPLAA